MATISDGEPQQKAAGVRMGDTGTMALAGIVSRVINAALVFLSQILFARVMGVQDFGIYAFANQLMLLMAGIAMMGLIMVPQRYLPEYDLAGDRATEKGLVAFSLRAPLLIGAVFAALGALLAFAGQPALGKPVALATALAMLTVPAQVSLDIVEGIAMARGWKMLAYALGFVLRPLLVPALFLAAWFFGQKPDALLATMVGVAACWIAAATLIILVQQKTRERLADVAARYEIRRWVQASLPVMAIHTAFMLMTTTDIVALALFRTTADVGTYSAAARLLALVAFIYHGLTWATGHHFSRLHANGETAALKTYVQRATLWTFFPSLAVAIGVAIATPVLLMLFGNDFAGALPITLILLVGLLARAAIGPAEQLLIMTDNQITCAYAYGWAFVVNVGLCLILVPLWGGIGAALATAIGYALASAIIAREVHAGFGFPIGIWSVIRQRPAAIDPATIVGLSATLETRSGASTTLESVAHFHSPFASTAVQAVTLADGGKAHALIVRDASTAMIGVWPMRPHRLGKCISVLKTPNDANFETDGDPIFAPGRELECLRIIADGMHKKTLPEGIVFAQNLSASGPLQEALQQLERDGVLHLRSLLTWQRPMLVANPGSTAAQYIRAGLGKRRLSSVQNRLRRMRLKGNVAFKLLRNADALQALDRFIALEAAGWKGAGSTAIKQNTGRERYMRELCAALASSGTLAIGELTLDGAMIASGILVDNHGRYSFLRTTYDQAHAAESPGTLLDYVLIDHLLSDRKFKLLDAGTDSSVPARSLLFADHAERTDALIDFGRPLKAECAYTLRMLRGLAKQFVNRRSQAKYRSKIVA